MTVVKQKKARPLRQVLLFILFFSILAWLAWGMAGGQADEEVKGLAMLVWLLAPFLVSLLVRLFSRDWGEMGLGLKLGGNLRWYLFSLLIFPLIIAVVLLVGRALGAVSFAGLGSDLFVQSLTATLAFTFVKNIFEEFSWRGFLTPKVNQVVKRPLLGHLLVGLVWGSWHIPYYLRLLDSTSIAAYTTQSLAVFIPLVIISMVVAAILFGELRLITGSTWPAVLMHTVSNVLITTLLLDGFVDINASMQWLFTPSWEGIVSLLLILAAGLWVHRKREA